MASGHYWFGVAAIVSMFGVSFVLAGPLHDAAQKGDLSQVKQLITEGANVNAKDKNGITPLHSAAVGDHMAVAELLIARGADVHAKTENGVTPLHLAIFWGHDQMVEFLKQHGATD